MLFLLAIAIALVMTALAWSRYTSIGVDVLTGDVGARTESSTRIRWFGDGTLHLGISRHPTSATEGGAGTLIDPAATIFDRSGEREIGALESLVHFEALDQAADLQRAQLGGDYERWLVMPAWLPLALLVGAGYAANRPQRH